MFPTAIGQVLCVDVGPEMGSEWIGAGPGGGPTSRMRVVQAALSGFVRRKCTFNARVWYLLLRVIRRLQLQDSVLVCPPLQAERVSFVLADISP